MTFEASSNPFPKGIVRGAGTPEKVPGDASKNETGEGGEDFKSHNEKDSVFFTALKCP